MNVLLIGSGGREHALAWKISTSPLLDRFYCAPGNLGISQFAENIRLDLSNHIDVVAFCHKKNVDLVVIGPEKPLVEGLSDSLRKAHIRVVGPSAASARLESSKAFTKDLCTRLSIPTAVYGRFTNANEAKSYIFSHGAPIVIKADGLMSGKGVVVAMTLKEALAAVDSYFDGKGSNMEIVIEEFLQGEEVSFFCLCHGEIAVPLGSARDYKRVWDGDTGKNTGGMGAYSPVAAMTPYMVMRIMHEFIQPTLKEMVAIGSPFSGILFAGLMITDDGPKLIEYNVRFGDPECQVLMMRFKDDLLQIFVATAEGNLAFASEPELLDEASLTIVLAAKGYPESPLKGSQIHGVEEVAFLPHVMLFHAGTAEKDGKLLADGGRVLNIAAYGKTLKEAQEKAYSAIEKIRWREGFWRSDIGR
ncbi:MAG: phosphoribosylamine--glycine ligase [Candidatus Tokpelaia sp. JSC161]|jgi:phosphoribosylamine--glycine ligase|nr:MAG: phosphoribosylamine--glycine ligase [Candidatus Tokpelaia sp. JSC161]